MIYLLDLFGTAVFAIAGSLAAGKKHMDIFGVLVVAFATALGGGTLRDVILGSHNVFWISDTAYILVAFCASVLTFALARIFTRRNKILQVADAFGLAIFTVIGTQKAAALGASPIICVIMGMTTGVAGGMIRDLLLGEIPLILRAEIYATASLCGAAAFVALLYLSLAENINIFVSVAVTLTLRLAAIHWKLSLPVFSIKD